MVFFYSPLIHLFSIQTQIVINSGKADKNNIEGNIVSMHWNLFVFNTNNISCQYAEATYYEQSKTSKPSHFQPLQNNVLIPDLMLILQ